MDVDDPDHPSNLDSDGDGLVDLIDPDDNNNGILDINELPEYGKMSYLNIEDNQLVPKIFNAMS